MEFMQFFAGDETMSEQRTKELETIVDIYLGEGTMKNIEENELTEEVLANCWQVIGGAPHLFEYEKDAFKEGLLSGDWSEGELMLDAYTMAALVDALRIMGFNLDTNEIREFKLHYKSDNLEETKPPNS